MAIWEKEIPFNPNWLTFKESSYTSVLGYNAEDFQAVVDRLRDGTWLCPNGTPGARVGTVLTGYRNDQTHQDDYRQD